MLRNHTDWYGWKAGTGTNVGEPTMSYGDSRDREEALTKMEAQNVRWIGHGGEGDLLIPAQEKLYVGANLIAEKSASGDKVRSESRFDRSIRELFHRTLLRI
jgi:hypothetical protein